MPYSTSVTASLGVWVYGHLDAHSDKNKVSLEYTVTLIFVIMASRWKEPSLFRGFLKGKRPCSSVSSSGSKRPKVIFSVAAVVASVPTSTSQQHQPK